MHDTTIYRLNISGKGFSHEFHTVGYPTVQEVMVILQTKIDRLRAEGDKLNKDASFEPDEQEIAVGRIDDSIGKLVLCLEVLPLVRRMPVLEAGSDDEIRHQITVAGSSVGWLYIQPIRGFNVETK